MTKSFLKIISVYLICVFVFCGCKKGYSGLDKPLQGAEPNAQVISDGGLAIKQGQWIYYVNGDNFTRHEGERFSEYSGALLRMKEDGSEKAVVLNMDVSLFNIRDGKIYVLVYEKDRSVIASVNIDGTNYNELRAIDDIYYGGCYGFSGEYFYYTKNFMLYRMNIDGKNEVQLTKFPIYNLRVGDEYVYFTRETDENIGNLYKIVDGEDSYTEITLEAAYVIYVKGEFAYYYILDNGKVYKYNAKSGKSEAVIFGGYTDYLFCEDENFYAISSSIESDEQTFDGIYTVPAGGGQKTQISSNSGRCMAYYNGFVYYVNLSSLNQLYRCSLDGKTDECISEEFVYDYDTLDIVGKYLYFISDSDYDRIYRVNMDTCDVECIEYDDISVVG